MGKYNDCFGLWHIKCEVDCANEWLVLFTSLVVTLFIIGKVCDSLIWNYQLSVCLLELFEVTLLLNCCLILKISHFFLFSSVCETFCESVLFQCAG